MKNAENMSFSYAKCLLAQEENNVKNIRKAILCTTAVYELPPNCMNDKPEAMAEKKCYKWKTIVRKQMNANDIQRTFIRKTTTMIILCFRIQKRMLFHIWEIST